MFSTEVVYNKGASVKYYISKAGGTTDNAKVGSVYVLNSNGTASKTKKFLFFRKFPKVSMDSEIIIPRLIEKNKKGLTSAEWLAVASGMASLAGVVVAIINVSQR
jgi:hypothetical protein